LKFEFWQEPFFKRPGKMADARETNKKPQQNTEATCRPTTEQHETTTKMLASLSRIQSCQAPAMPGVSCGYELSPNEK